MEDLVSLVPGAFNAPPYGIAGVPMIRGDLGDAARNGQRRAFNRNVFPVSFNSVESVEVLAGAPPAFLGPTNGTGGFVNLITKRPSFLESRGFAEVTAGAWDEWRGQVDRSIAWSDRFAGRFSVERAERGSFHRFAGGRSWDVFGAIAWRPAEGTRWDLSIESYQAHYLENPGTNRPTQALIDRGEYVTGSSVQGGGGSYFRNTFTPTGTVRIDGSQILAAPGDGAWARAWTAQLIGEWKDAAGRRVTSRTYFEHVSSEKHAAYQFYSFVPRSRTIEHRVEVDGRGRIGSTGHDYGWGVAWRGEERVSFVDFLNEAMNAFDLTMDPETFRYPVGRLFGVLEVPGKPGRYAVPGGRYGVAPPPAISQTLHSRLGSAGVFLKDRFDVGSRLSVAANARGDVLAVQSEDPLPRPGFSPARDGITRFVGGGTLSAIWRIDGNASLYATYNDASAVESSSSSGGFGLTGNRLPRELFANRSRLLEAGIRVSDPAERVTGGVTWYHQRRHRQNPRTGRPDEIGVTGAELQGEWRPASRLEIAANGAFTEARYLDGPPAGSIATVPGFDPAVPSPNFGAFAPGDHRIPGWPRWQANLHVRWQPVRGVKLRVSGRLQGPQNLDLFGEVRLPAQQTWDAGITWTREGWELRLDVLNLTDEFNWRPTSTPFAGGDLVTRELPRHWRASVRYAF